MHMCSAFHSLLFFTVIFKSSEAYLFYSMYLKINESEYDLFMKKIIFFSLLT